MLLASRSATKSRLVEATGDPLRLRSARPAELLHSRRLDHRLWLAGGAQLQLGEGTVRSGHNDRCGKTGSNTSGEPGSLCPCEIWRPPRLARPDLAENKGMTIRRRRDTGTDIAWRRRSPILDRLAQELLEVRGSDSEGSMANLADADEGDQSRSFESL